MAIHSLLRSEQKRRWVTLWVVAAIILACGAVIAPTRVWSNLLVDTYYLLTLALGGAVFVALAYVCGASWNVAFRRVPEALAMMIPVAGAAIVAVLAMRMNHYGWHAHGDGDPGTMAFKQFWLTPSFWLLRAVAYVVVWSLLAGWLVARSRKQDTNANASMMTGNVRLSALFLAVYAVTFSLASADWIMALEPMWFSTIWGVYNFAGMVQAALAATIVLMLLLRARSTTLSETFNDEHLHDLGKLLLGFSCFWMYIWFSQYMLIWYANIPEETTYFVARTQGSWGPVVIVSIALNWVVPFFLLLPRAAKRSPDIMMRIAVAVLIGRWVDIYVMVFPPTQGPNPVFGVLELAAVGGLIASVALLYDNRFSKAPPVPTHDPLLKESLHYHAS